MDRDIKKNIKLLADKFNHMIEYDGNTVLAKSEFNEVKIWEEDKYGINVSYNLNDDLIKILKVESENIYDILIEIFKREKKEKEVIANTGVLLTIEEWTKEEGGFSKTQLDELKARLKKESIEYEHLGGNRYEAEYFKGVLILTDDLCWAKSNVVLIC